MSGSTISMIGYAGIALFNVLLALYRARIPHLPAPEQRHARTDAQVWAAAFVVTLALATHHIQEA